MTSIKNDDINIGEMSKRKTERGLDLSSVFVAIALFYYFTAMSATITNFMTII